MGKLLDLESLSELDADQIDTICFGHFNVLHPGHFRFLEFAFQQGEHLCVLIQPDGDNLKPGQEDLFPECDRVKALENISIISSIIPCTKDKLSEAANIINPKYLVLGHEFEKSSDPQIKTLCKSVESKGGNVIFKSGDYRGVSLFDNRNWNSHAKQLNVENFKKACGRRNVDFGRLSEIVESYKNLKTLVIGDLIVDQFTSCEPLGVSKEAPVIVVRELNSTEFLGGAGIVAAHAASLGSDCILISVRADDNAGNQAMKMLKDFGIRDHTIVDNTRPTTFKTRYIANKQKIFRVSKLDDSIIDKKAEAQLINVLDAVLPTIDAIIVSDFVYGVVTDNLLDYLIDYSLSRGIPIYGDLQCSSQIGDVTRFRNFTAIFPTEVEARLAIRNKDDGIEFVAQKVLETAQCSNLFLKLGAEGLITYQSKTKDVGTREHFPALSINPVDVSGAGDSLLASASLALTAGANTFEAAAIGSIVAACAIEKMGNYPIEKSNILSAINRLKQ
ncbi:MAG: PfkB family carbohydrate kinase [Pseudomonadota bacterium]|nr:PfkB family carbohydrate kinase [Pseudomonadota bacterium]